MPLIHMKANPDNVKGLGTSNVSNQSLFTPVAAKALLAKMNRPEHTVLRFVLSRVLFGNLCEGFDQARFSGMLFLAMLCLSVVHLLPNLAVMRTPLWCAPIFFILCYSANRSQHKTLRGTWVLGMQKLHRQF